MMMMVFLMLMMMMLTMTEFLMKRMLMMIMMEFLMVKMMMMIMMVLMMTRMTMTTMTELKTMWMMTMRGVILILTVTISQILKTQMMIMMVKLMLMMLLLMMMMMPELALTPLDLATEQPGDPSSSSLHLSCCSSVTENLRRFSTRKDKLRKKKRKRVERPKSQYFLRNQSPC